MATVEVLPFPDVPQALFKPIIDNATVKRKLESIDFDPDQHLVFEPPANVLLMTDIGYSEDTGYVYSV